MFICCYPKISKTYVEKKNMRKKNIHLNILLFLRCPALVIGKKLGNAGKSVYQ